MAKGHHFTAWLVLIFLFGGCSGKPSNQQVHEAIENPLVVTTSYPLTYFADRISGKKIDVLYPPKGIDQSMQVASWQPSDGAILEMQRADRVITNGSGFENWLPLIPLRESAIVDTSRAIQSQLLELDGKRVHQHGPEGAKSKNAPAFATWLNPELAISQAQIIKETMIDLMPSEKKLFEANFNSLKADLQSLNESLTQPSSGFLSGQGLAAQPVYQYLGQALEIPIRDLNWKSTDRINEAQWQALDEAIANQPAQWILWDGVMTDQIRKNFQARNIEVLDFPTLMDPPVSGDFLSQMRDNIARMNKSLSKE